MIFDIDEERETFDVLAKTYFARGGQQYTDTVVSAENLLATKKNHDAYRDLIVRVSCCSAYFVNISAGLQESVVIALNLHNL